MSERTPIHRGRVALAVSVAFALSLVMGLVPAMAGHPEVSLPGSDFEIDTNANLKQDDPSPSEDWVTIPQGMTTGTEIRQNDVPSGGTDNAFTGGAKEDTPVPAVSNGGIPPGKADLKTFAGYLETNDAGHKFLNLFWTRVQEPAGSTNVDFEFNKSEEISDNGVTPERTAGDVLIQYDLASGGTNVQLFLSRWITTGSNSQCAAQGGKVPCWGNAPPTAPRQNLTTAGIGTGSINTTPIVNDPATPGVDETDGLGPLSARTFGEAQIDFDAFTSGGGADPCVSFGSGFVKSRSSDSFTAELKDFIAPVALNFSNCGRIHVIKHDDATPPALLDGAEFDLLKDNAPIGGSPGPEDTFVDDCITVAGVCDFIDVLQGEYWVVETVAPTGHDLPTPAFQHVTVVADEQVTVTFVNPRQLGAIDILKTDDTGAFMEGVKFDLFNDAAPLNGPAPHGVEDTAVVPAKSCTTDAAGECTIADIVPGQYWVVEDTATLPAGFDPAPDQNVVVDASETVSLTFVDPRQTGAIQVTKTRKHAAATEGDPLNQPHPGVDFTITGGSLPAGGTTITTNAQGVACLDGLVLSALQGIGNYTVHEVTPSGYAGEADETVTVDNKATCDAPYVGEAVSFHNTPLTNITVSVDSQVPGGTGSTIDCDAAADPPFDKTVPAAAPDNGDGSFTLSDKEPGTYTCVIVVDP